MSDNYILNKNQETTAINHPVDKLTFCLIHGSWHGSWCWDLLRPKLESAGHNTTAPDMPLDSADASFEDYADIAVHDLGDEPAIIVGHSRMGNLLPRIASKIAVKHLVYLCAGFDPNNSDYFRRGRLLQAPKKYQKGFINGIIYEPDNQQLAKYDPQLAGNVFYNDCSKEIRDWAVANLRPQYRPKQQKPITSWPDAPSTYIYTTGDRVIRPRYSRYVAKSIGAKTIKLTGGHSPFLSRPDELAEILESLT